jgi:DNA-directed RNA polymerase sigma subunit (sigma70/sigma32)
LKTKEEYANRRPLILKARREGQTLAAIGNAWGITGSRVRQIIKEELRRRGCDT